MTILALKAAAAANDDATSAMDQGSKAQSSQALILQAYALSVLQQPLLNLNTKSLEPLQNDMNASLKAAMAHANNYKNVILPSMLTSLTSMNQYFNLQNALATALTPSTDQKTTVAALNAVLDQANGYKSDAVSLQQQLAGLSSDISGDASKFNGFVTQLNAALNGDNGVLTDLQNQLGSIDGKIDGAITGTVLSGLAILGGAFLIAVGAIADFVTAGTSTPLIIAGIGIVATGVGGEVASAVTLSNLINMKADMLRQQAQLQAEVQLAAGLQSGYTSLSNAAVSAATAAQQMSNAWGLLGGHLSNLITDVEKGKQNAGTLQTLFLTAAKGAVADVQTDITTIDRQLTGAQQVATPSNATIAQQVVQMAQKAAA
jgi:hypothetical protein